MSKAILVTKAARFADASAIAAIEAATAARLGYPSELLESRAARLAALSDDYAKAARLAH